MERSDKLVKSPVEFGSGREQGLEYFKEREEGCRTLMLGGRETVGMVGEWEE